jgi:hypothetical protein
LRRFRNKSPPRKTKRYGDKICPIDENIMPLNIESGITIISIPKALLLLVNYDIDSNIAVVINIVGGGLRWAGRDSFPFPFNPHLKRLEISNTIMYVLL